MHDRARLRRFNMDRSKALHAVLVAFCLVSLVFACARDRGDQSPATIGVRVDDDVDLVIVDWGGMGPPLLFLPSWGSTSHIYDEFAPRFTDDYRVLVMDIRGHGASSRPSDGYTIDRLTKDIEAVLDQLGIDRITLVGLSRSESLTTQFAARYPDRTKALVYLSGPIDREYYRAFIGQPGMRERNQQRGKIDDALIALCDIKPGPPRPPGSFDDMANEIGTEWRDTDPTPPYAQVESPALAFWAPASADQDRYRAACRDAGKTSEALGLIEQYEDLSVPFGERMEHDQALFESAMRDGEIVEIPGGHYHTFASHPDRVEQKMREFLGSLPD